MLSLSTKSVACALLIASPASMPLAAAAAPAAAEPLVGLWKAKKRFGPDAAGTLVIKRDGGQYFADLAGRLLPVRFEHGELSFALPGDRGRFEGKLDGARIIRGHWIRPGTPPNSGRYASPVVLRADAGSRWSGKVEPLQDAFTFYLLIEKAVDGSLRAILRNPERDVGSQLGARQIRRDGKVVQLIGGRPGRADTPLASGTFDPANDGFTLWFPNRGGAYDFTRDGDDSDFYPRGRHPERYMYHRPIPFDDGWPTGTLDGAGINREAIERLVQAILEAPMASPDAPQIHALLVARHGRLVLEEYFHGFGREQLHDTRSAGKSMTAIAIGAALRGGAPLALSSPVYQVMSGGSFPVGIESQKRSMTLAHLLTMSSGYFCDDNNEAAPGNEDAMQEQAEEPDWYRYTLRVPLASTPGENAVYCSASPNLALGMLGAATGETPLRTFDRLVAAPLGIRRYAWFLDPAGHPYGGGGLQLLPRDFLKLGQLMLDKGTWRGRHVLDPAFATRATSPLYHLRNIYYGYLWWVEDYPYKDRTVRSFSARGAGGQVVTVVPELDLVVATMAGNYFSRVQITGTGTLVPRLVLPAVRERGDDPRAPVRERAFTTPYGPSPNGSRVTTMR